jgi:predicted TIM-barrel fold metal-dependent hydrolase
VTVIDTEVHVIERLWPSPVNPGRSRTEPHTWHAHDGDLLVAEMDRAGVASAFLIGYDGYDIESYLEEFDSAPDQFMGGRSYALHFVEKYPGRFQYFTTLRDPRTRDGLRGLRAEFDRGAAGVKIFPNYLRMGLDDDALRPIYEFCATSGLRVMYGLEGTSPPVTSSFDQYWRQFERVHERYGSLLFQFNHAGAAPLPSNDATSFFKLVRSSERVFISTAYLGMEWSDEWRYPFPRFLERLKVVYDAIGADQMMWGTDWPWLEEWTKYPQLVEAVRDHAPFLRGSDLDAYLGGNASRFLPTGNHDGARIAEPVAADDRTETVPTEDA